jgi:hypothetical protein
MKRILFFLSLSIGLSPTFAQLSTSVISTDATCWNSNDGSYTVGSIQGCFAPLTIEIDSTTYEISSFTNNGYDYINQGGGTGDQRAFSVWAGQTSAGPVYIAAGTFADSITFDTITLYSNATLNMFVACFDATTSEVMWAHQGSTPGNTYTAAYAVTGAGNKAYVTGYFSGNATIANQAISSTGGYQAYIAKIDIPSGSTENVVQIGGGGVEEGYNLTYAAGRIYLVGDFSGTITLAGNTFASAGNQDAFILCMDTTLATSYWSAKAGGSGFDVFNDAVAYVNNGVTERVYVTGEFVGNATVGTQTYSSSGQRDFYVASLDTNGVFGWVTQGGGPNNDYCTTIDINTSGDRIYTGGSWRSTMNFGGQLYTAGVSDDGFIAYLDSAGNMDTLFALSGTGADYVADLQSVEDDYIVFSGSYGGALTYADSLFTSNGNFDAFMGKIGPGLNEIWGKNFGGTNNEAFSSIRIGPDERLHTAGFFQGNCSAYQAGLIALGGQDAIVTNQSLAGTADTSITITGLSAGMYTYQVIDSMGNILIDTVVIGSPDSFDISGVVSNASSAVATDGAIDLSVSGATPGYSYLWSNGAATQDLTAIPTGTYCVTVTDSIGCTDTMCFFVDSNIIATPMVVTASLSHLACFGDNSGAIDLTVSGGIPPYTFNWSNGATTEDLTSISGGVYTVTINDNDTAVFIDSFTVNQPAEIIIVGSITPPTSGSSSDGAIDVTTSGGQPSYSFSWSNGALTEDLLNIGVGTYTLTVTDSAGCSNDQTFQVDTIPALSLVSLATAVTCINTDNGAIDLTVIGGVAPFTFSWSNGAVTEDINGLAAGIYTVTVTDSIAQQAILEDSVDSNPTFPDPVVGPISGPASAQSFVSYNYSVPVSNGSTFLWSANGGAINSAASNAASILWYAGPQGTLFVQEVDAHGCSAIDSLEVSILFVGIDEDGSEGILIYPNPSIDVIHVRLPEGLSCDALELYDLQGRLLMHQQTLQGTHTLDVSDLSAGSYLMRLNMGGTIISQTVVIR